MSEESGEITVHDVITPGRLMASMGQEVPVLIIMHGGEERAPFPIRQERITIGRVEQCDIVLPEPNVSRIHAFLRCTPSEQAGRPVCLLSDNQSTNGIYLNSQPVRQEQQLQHGDQFTIGDYLFGFFIRRERELEVEERAHRALSRFGRQAMRARIPSDYKVQLKILLPDQTFTPKELSGQAQDVSMTGLRFVTGDVSEDFFRSMLQSNRHLRCKVVMQTSRRLYELQGRMCWVHFDNKKDPPSCVMGVEFQELPPQTRLQLGEEIGALDSE